MVKVFAAQDEMNKSAKESIIGDSQSSKPMPMSLQETKDGKILAATRGKNGNVKVYASEEFGDNTFITIQMPEPPKYGSADKDVMKQNLRWVDGLVIKKTKLEGVINLNKYAVLEGNFADPEKLLENINFLNKQLKATADKMEQYQRDKAAFIAAMEAKIKKVGASLFSKNEKKDQRNFLMYDLKFFQKTMDQPGLMYYGLVDGIVNAFMNLCTYVVHFNHTNGNHAQLKKDGH
jgi:hypothetical protein